MLHTLETAQAATQKTCHEHFSQNNEWMHGIQGTLTLTSIIWCIILFQVTLNTLTILSTITDRNCCYFLKFEDPHMFLQNFISCIQALLRLIDRFLNFYAQSTKKGTTTSYTISVRKNVRISTRSKILTLSDTFHCSCLKKFGEKWTWMNGGKTENWMNRESRN